MTKYIRTFLTITLVAILLPTTAFAEGETLSEIQLSPLTIQLVIGLVIPLAVGLATRYTTSAGFKVLLTMVLNAVQTLIVQATVASGVAIISKETFIAWLMALVVSIATYLGVYKPVNLTSSSPDGALLPNKGL